MPSHSQLFRGTELELHRPIQLQPLCRTDFISQTHPSVKGIQKAFDIFDIYVDALPRSQDNGTQKLQCRDVYDLVYTVDDMITRQFQMIGFIHWALYSIGFSTKEIITFQQLVKNLCTYLHGVISQTGIQKDQLEFSKNPFVKAVIDERDIKDIFALGTRFIIEPLQTFFYTWNPEALQEIQFLKVRFDRQHLSDTPDTEPFSLFDTDTSFLSSLQANLSHLAITRTRGDLEEFRKIEERQVREGRLEALGNRWNAYSHTVRDCAVLVGEKRLIRLAYVRLISSLLAVTF
ncbi:hypothetical protein EYB25_003205 [Talaromyces marneffei]|nr:hypothetical protein EYB25_003205 [Talaromyces marneffei]